MNVYGELVRAQVEILQADPSGGANEGRIWFNDVSNVLKFDNGSSVVQIIDTSVLALTDTAYLSGVAALLSLTEVGYLNGVTSSVQDQLDTLSTMTGVRTLKSDGTDPGAHGISRSAQFTFSTNSVSEVTVTGASVTLTSAGGPVRIEFAPGDWIGLGGGYSDIRLAIGTDTHATCILNFYKDGVPFTQIELVSYANHSWCPTSVGVWDFAPSGAAVTYTVKAYMGDTKQTVYFYQVRMVAYEP